MQQPLLSSVSQVYVAPSESSVASASLRLSRACLGEQPQLPTLGAVSAAAALPAGGSFGEAGPLAILILTPVSAVEPPVTRAFDLVSALIFFFSSSVRTLRVSRLSQ
eukprot:COSAG06_NODE_606_length_13867_cov_16.158701_7_plen_107_part_00